MVQSDQAEQGGRQPFPAPGTASDPFAPGHAWVHFMSTRSIDESIGLWEEVFKTHEHGVPLKIAIRGIVGSAERWHEVVADVVEFAGDGQLEIVDYGQLRMVD